ncbi:MAG TPA: hypothetical protein VF384_17600 [Planctomycetota bacterium]
MTKPRQYALCVENRGYRAALEQRKIYQRIPDRAAQKLGLMRIVDESGEDYLYPAALFVPIEVPREAARLFINRSA